MGSDEGTTEQQRKSGVNAGAVYALIGLLSVVLVAGLVGLLLQNQSQADDLDNLKTEVEALQNPDEEDLAQAETSSKKVKSIAKDMSLVLRCIPEIQSQLNSIEVNGGFASPTDQISAECSSLVYPNFSAE